MAKGKSSPVSKAVHFEDLPEEFRQCIDDYIVNGNKSKAFELTQPDNDNKTSMRVNAQIFFKKENIQNIVAERKQQLASVGSIIFGFASLGWWDETSFLLGTLLSIGGFCFFEELVFWELTIRNDKIRVQ